jgi:hypothetical protein
MEIKKYSNRLVVSIGKLQVHIELDLREISLGLFWGFERYQSAWFGIKIPFLTIETSWDMYDEDKAPMIMLNLPPELKAMVQEMELQNLLKESK